MPVGRSTLIGLIDVDHVEACEFEAVMYVYVDCFGLSMLSI